MHGSCLCGAVRFEFDAPTEHFVLCHCHRCKKSSGSAFLAGMTVSGLRFVSGEELINSFEAPIVVVPPAYRRDFCTTCGSPVPWPVVEGELHVVPAGLLDVDPGVKPREHVWVDCEAEWEQDTEGLPRLTEAQFVLDRVRAIDRAGGDNLADHYRFIVERYADNEADAAVVAAAKTRLSELSGAGA